MQKNGIMMPCQHCGKEIYVIKARQDKFKYCSYSCHAKTIFTKETQKKIKRLYGKDNPRWSGGRCKRKDGYILICRDGRRVFEHRYVMEQHLGRKLSFNETVHHIDGNKENNNLNNLELLSRSEHTIKYHKKKHAISKSKRSEVGKCYTREI